MDDALSFLLVAAIYLFAAFFKANKKKRKRGRERRGPMRTRAQGEQRDKRAAEMDRKTQSGFDEAFVTPQDAAQPPKHACGEERQMHLHKVSQELFAHAAEGEDPCHAGQSDFAQDDSFFDMQEMENQRSALAQDVLRGVVMSEILIRPQERAALRRGRR